MKYALLSIVLFVILLACTNTTNSSNTTPATLSGNDIYKKYCVTCHGADGKLGLNGAKQLPESTLTLDQRIETITNGRGVMTPFREILKPEEIQAVANYTMQLK